VGGSGNLQFSLFGDENRFDLRSEQFNSVLSNKYFYHLVLHYRQLPDEHPCYELHKLYVEYIGEFARTGQVIVFFPVWNY
jgi:hypothetical protein